MVWLLEEMELLEELSIRPLLEELELLEELSELIDERLD